LINQPRVPEGRHHHRHWAWIDAGAQAALSASLLERMAVLLSEEELSQELAAEHAALARALNSFMWNEESAFYHDIGPDGRFSPVKSIAAYWMLMDPQLAPKERLQPFIQHLRDAWSFKTETVVPSMAADSDAYNGRTGNGWRGGVWPALTYMVLRGLHNADQQLLAHKLAQNHIDAVWRVFDQTGHFWTHYAPEESGPGEPATVDESGQTAAVILAMMLENILGFSIDWPLRQVTWRRCLEREKGYGVRNLPLGDEGTLDLFAAGEAIHIRSDATFTLNVYDGQDVVKTAVPAGNFEISLK
jgi:hypothetical protein